MTMTMDQAAVSLEAVVTALQETEQLEADTLAALVDAQPGDLHTLAAQAAACRTRHAVLGHVKEVRAERLRLARVAAAEEELTGLRAASAEASKLVAQLEAQQKEVNREGARLSADPADDKERKRLLKELAGLEADLVPARRSAQEKSAAYTRGLQELEAIRAGRR
jgi:vacuolar-type H+-ATPase subunit I/STV1